MAWQVWRFKARFMLAVCFTMFCSDASLAHNVVSGAYADGMLIEGEIGFSNGDMAEAGIPVKVFNQAGDLLAEIALADGGVFTYEAKMIAQHIFKSNLSAGHVAEIVVEADELSAGESTAKIAQAQPLKANKPEGNSNTPNASDGSNEADSSAANIVSAEQLERIVRTAVAQQVRPLQKELRAYKEKVMFRDIAGGLGFIFGLFGVAAWMASRRKEREKDASVS